MSAPRTDRSPWNWLLVVPIVIPLLTPLYNFDAPRLWGFPAFYWLQFAFIFVGVATTSIVYQMTRRPPHESALPASRASAAPPSATTSSTSPAEASDE
jgi:hypothetical protein